MRTALAIQLISADAESIVDFEVAHSKDFHDEVRLPFSGLRIAGLSTLSGLPGPSARNRAPASSRRSNRPRARGRIKEHRPDSDLRTAS